MPRALDDFGFPIRLERWSWNDGRHTNCRECGPANVVPATTERHGLPVCERCAGIMDYFDGLTLRQKRRMFGPAGGQQVAVDDYDGEGYLGREDRPVNDNVRDVA